MYSSAYRGERHRATAFAGKPPRWARVRMAVLLLLMAVAGFWAVRLAIWAAMHWRN
jgi:hypothetical protein